MEHAIICRGGGACHKGGPQIQPFRPMCSADRSKWALGHRAGRSMLHQEPHGHVPPLASPSTTPEWEEQKGSARDEFHTIQAVGKKLFYNFKPPDLRSNTKGIWLGVRRDLGSNPDCLLSVCVCDLRPTAPRPCPGTLCCLTFTPEVKHDRQRVSLEHLLPLIIQLNPQSGASTFLGTKEQKFPSQHCCISFLRSLPLEHSTTLGSSAPTLSLHSGSQGQGSYRGLLLFGI